MTHLQALRAPIRAQKVLSSGGCRYDIGETEKALFWVSS